MSQFDIELEVLEEQLKSGDITTAEYGCLSCELERDYRDAARESAQDAYDNEFEQW